MIDLRDAVAANHDRHVGPQRATTRVDDRDMRDGERRLRGEKKRGDQVSFSILLARRRCGSRTAESRRGDVRNAGVVHHLIQHRQIFLCDVARFGVRRRKQSLQDLDLLELRGRRRCCVVFDAAKELSDALGDRWRRVDERRTGGA